MVILIIFLYMFIILCIAFTISKKRIKNALDFTIAGRSLGPYILACTLAATEIGGGSTIGVAAKAYGEWGLSAAFYVICCGIGIFFVSFIAPYIRATFVVTLPEIINNKFGKEPYILTAIISIIALFIAAAVQITATSTIINVNTGLNVSTSIVISGAVITIYTLIGGLISVAATDIIHIIFITLGMAFICPIVIHNAGGLDIIKMNLPESQFSLTLISYKTIIGLILMYFMTFSTGQEAVQKFFAAKNPKTAMLGAFYCAIIMCLYGFVPALYGLVARAHFPNIDPNTALSIATINFAPPILSGIVLAALCAATMSSAAGDLIAASTILTQDIILQRFKKSINDSKIIILNKVTILIIGTCAISISLMNFGIIPLLIFAFTIRSTGPFASIILGLFYKRATKLASTCSIITGSISAIIWMIYGEPFDIMSIIFGSIISIITFLGISEIQHRIQ